MTPDHPRRAGLGAETVDRSRLPNGVTLLVYANPTSPSVAVAGQHLAGAVMEDEADCGLASLTADALNRGTASRSFHEFSAELDAVGASLGFGASLEQASFYGRALAEDIDVLFRLAADGLRNPTFPAEEVGRLRDQVLTGIAHIEDDPDALAERRFRELLYGPGNPLGRPTEGYASTVRGLTPDALRDFHARTYDPLALTIAVVGAVETAAVRDLAAAEFGGWKAPSNGSTREAWTAAIERYDAAERARAAHPLREDLTLAGKTQTEFTLGWLGVRRGDPTYYASMVGNFILGQLGLGGRIGANVRDKQGLAYHASSSVEVGRTRRPWTLRAGINPANVERAVASSLEEARGLCERPVTDEELRLTKQAMIGSLPLRLERNGGIAQMLLTIERFGLGLDYLSRYPDMVNGVTARDVQDAASAVLARPGYTLVTAGPRLPA